MTISHNRQDAKSHVIRILIDIIIDIIETRNEEIEDRNLIAS